MSDLANLIAAIKQGDLERVRAILDTNAGLANVRRQARDTSGRPFQRLARESGNREIARLFGLEDVEDEGHNTL